MDSKMAERMQELVERLNQLNVHYYTLDDPLVSDAEYDVLYDELVALEKETGVAHSCDTKWPYSPNPRRVAVPHAFLRQPALPPRSHFVHNETEPLPLHHWLSRDF